MKKLVFIFAAMTVLAFAACTETKAPKTPIEEADISAVDENEADMMIVEDTAEVASENAAENAAMDAAMDAAVDAAKVAAEDGGEAAEAAKDAANEGVRDDISVKK